MFTSVFNKSKPYHIFIALALIFIAYVLHTCQKSFSITSIQVFFVNVLSLFVLGFIFSKNNLTKKNSFAIIFYALFILSFLAVFENKTNIFSSFFVLLALRRLLSLHTKKDISKKLFDAAFWITIAALFQFWAILFLVLVFISLVAFSNSAIRYWLIPFTGFLAVLIITSCYYILTENIFFNIDLINPETSFNFSGYNSISYLIDFTVLLAISIWSIVFYLIHLNSKKNALKPLLKIMIAWLILAFIIALILPYKNTSEFSFLFAPLALVITNYLETVKDKWFKELLFLGIVILPIIMLLL